MRLSLLTTVLFPTLLMLGLFPNLVQAEPSRYALVVGVREYPASEKLPNLPYTESDADKISATLNAAGYRVILMTQTTAKPVGGQRFNPTAAFIRKQFAGLVGTPFLKKEDCLLVVLEGHGIELPSKTNPKQQTFYFCPADAAIDKLEFSEDVTDRHNLIRVQEFYDTLSKSQAGVKLLITDACRNDPNKKDSFRSSHSQTRPPIPLPPGGIAAFFSCSAGQRAVEDETLKHGVFSYYLIEGLSGKADSDNDRQVTVSELQTYVGKRTYDYVFTKYSRTQLPDLTGNIKGFAPLLSIPEQSFAGKKAGDLWAANGLNMKFRWCPPGTFTMGSPVSEKDRHDDENQVKVTLTKGFWLGQHEVTQGEWKKLMGVTPGKGRTEVKEGSNYAATYVSWEDVTAYCLKLTEQERKAGRLPTEWEYRLPTEAQWEYACRAGTTTRFSFGDDLEYSQLSAYAWFDKIADDIGEKYAHEVGQKKANAWNLNDMHGNVWEWCRDSYTEKLSGGTDPEILEKSTLRVDRGGCWRYSGRLCRSANRSKISATFRLKLLGLRVAIVQTR